MTSNRSKRPASELAPVHGAEASENSIATPFRAIARRMGARLGPGHYLNLGGKP